MTCMDEGNNKKHNKTNLGDIDLTCKIKGSSVSRKMKNVIVGDNVKASKTLHQKFNAIKDLTKATERN